MRRRDILQSAPGRVYLSRRAHYRLHGILEDLPRGHRHLPHQCMHMHMTMHVQFL